MATRDPRAWVIKRLEDAMGEITTLASGPDEVTPAFDNWVAGVKRALNSAFGNGHHLTREFEALTLLSVGFTVQRGVAGSGRQFEQRNAPHVVLRRARPLLEHALGELVVASPSGSPAGGVTPAVGTATSLRSEAIDAGGEDPPTVFISYTWESTEHKSWVKALAIQLQADGVRVTLDQWEVAPGDQLPAFMERSVRENKYVLVVCTPTYKQKSDARTGGAGYEGDIMTGELFGNSPSRKFIPVLRIGDVSSAVPSWLRGRYHIDLSSSHGDSNFEAQYHDLLTTLHGERERAPALGIRARPTVQSSGEDVWRGAPAVTNGHGHPEAVASSPDEDEPLRILGVIADQVSAPRNDGTRGSALYRVPFRLSRTPSLEWSRRFVQVWDRPPQYTSMHRSRIARVEGDTIVLDGTTLDEVQRFHRDTLKLVVETVNREVLEEERELRRRATAAAQAEKDRRSEIERLAREISFD